MKKQHRILKAFLAAAVAAAAAQASFAQDAAAQAATADPGPRLDLSAAVEAGWEGKLFTRETGRAEFSDGTFSVVAGLSLSNDGKYKPSHANTAEGTFFGNYFVMDEGGVLFSKGGISLRAGRLRHFDQVDSPYSLFVNGLGHAANLAELRYENDFFVYESRWVELNNRSSVNSPAWDAYWAKRNEYDHPRAPGDTTPRPAPRSGFPDRGANLKTYAFKLGGMRFGFQDAAVYTGLNFDAEYFLNPIPQYFIQYAKGTAGRPWSTSQNDNNLIGLFWDWEREDGSDYYAQYLMDDFWIPGAKYVYPNQMAWAAGGRWDTRFGRFGLHHGGALKYTFQANSMRGTTPTSLGSEEEDSYGYTYYPENEYGPAGDLLPISISDSALGFLHGENSGALMVDWSHEVADFGLSGSLELLLAGANSAANPWHDETAEEGLKTEWLYGDLQKSAVLKLRAERSFGAFDFFVALKAGYVWNVLELSSPTGVPDGASEIDKKARIWRPSANDKSVAAVTIGARYVFGVF